MSCFNVYDDLGHICVTDLAFSNSRAPRENIEISQKSYSNPSQILGRIFSRLTFRKMHAQFANSAEFILAHVEILAPFRLRLKALAVAHVKILVSLCLRCGTVALGQGRQAARAPGGVVAHVKILVPCS